MSLHRPGSGRRLLAVTAATALLASGCSVLSPAQAGPRGEIVVELADYRFGPDAIQVQAGETVTFVLRNVGEHTHEFMIGRDPHLPDDYLTGPIAEAFEEDFFEGIQVDFSGDGMPMNLAGAEMSGMDMGGEADDDMDMGSEADDGMDMPTEADDDMDMGSESPGTVVVAPEEGEEEHAGGMVMVDSGEEARITLTVPDDAVGEWTIGCFQEQGGHYADGMRASLTVVA